MSFFLINDIRLNLPMGWVPFQLLYLGPFSNVRCSKTKTLHFVRCYTHYQGFTRAYLVIRDTPAVLQ